MSKPSRRVLRLEHEKEDDDHPRFEHAQEQADDASTTYLCTDVNSQHRRNVADWPGWTPIGSTKRYVIKNPSFLTLRVRAIKSDKAPRSSEWVEGAHIEEHLRTLRSLLEPCSRQTLSQPISTTAPRDQDWLKRLKPPPIRHRGKPNLEDNFRILATSGWHTPAQGAVLEPPTWHPRFKDRFLVVSNTPFNERYFYPEIVVVPVTTTSSHGLTRSEAEKGGAMVVHLSATGEDLIPWSERVRTISFSGHWLGECYGCYDPENHRPEWWMIEGGEKQGHCLRCDGSKIDVDVWPKHVGTVAAEDMKKVVSDLTRRLALVNG